MLEVAACEVCGKTLIPRKEATLIFTGISLYVTNCCGISIMYEEHPIPENQITQEVT